MTLLNDPDLVSAYKIAVAVPGEFAITYPNTTDADCGLALMNGFAGAQLYGFFSEHTLNYDTTEVLPDLTGPAQALVVAFAGVQTLRNSIRQQATLTRYKAGPVEYEVGYGASVLTQLLKDAQGQLDRLLDLAVQTQRNVIGTTFVMDSYVGRIVGGYDLNEVTGATLSQLTG